MEFKVYLIRIATRGAIFTFLTFCERKVNVRSTKALHKNLKNWQNTFCVFNAVLKHITKGGQ